MTRHRVMPRALAIATVVVLAVGALALAGCVLDPDGGKSVPMSAFAPISVKEAVLASLAGQGFTPDSPSSANLTYPSQGDTSTILVAGTFYGPSKEKGVLTTYKEIKVSKQTDGSWKVTATTAGVAPADPKVGGEGEGGEGAKAEGAAGVEGGAAEGASGEATTEGK
jgi:hypothetical protein